MIGIKTKDPQAVLDYTIDWSAWLNGDTIVGSVWTVETGITKTTDSFTSTVTTVWLSGGTVGKDYEITNRVTTATGRIDDRTFIIHVEDR